MFSGKQKSGKRKSNKVPSATSVSDTDNCRYRLSDIRQYNI